MIDWLTQYFDCGVGFDLDRIEGRDKAYPEPLQTLLKKCVESCRTPRGPCVLPVVGEDKQVELMVAAVRAEESAELHGIAQAYLGSVYALVSSRIISKPISEAQTHLLKGLPGGIIRIRIPRVTRNNQDYQAHVYKAMEVVLEFLEQYKSRPPMLSNVRRSTGRVLRDLFIALRDQNSELGWHYFDELRRTGSLSARNLLFLEIQIQAAFENWEAIVEHPKLGDALSGRVPRGVAVAFLLAADTLFLNQGTLRGLSLDEARARLTPWTSFFASKPDLGEYDESIKMWRCWATGAALLGNLRGAVNVKDRVGTAWFQQLAESLNLPILEDTQSALVEDPLATVVSAPASLDTAIKLLEITLQGDQEQCRVVSETLQSYPVEILDQLRLKPPIRTLLDSLVDVAHPAKLDRGWKTWLQEAQRGTDPESLLESVIEGAAYWDKSEWDEKALNRLLDSGGSAVQQVLRDALPILLDWLDRNEITLGLGSAESLLLNLALDDVSSVQDLSLARDLLAIALAQPHTGAIYTSMLEAIQAIWEKIKSAHAVTGLCDVLDLLLEAPCANKTARQALWQDLQEFLLSNWKKMDKETRVLARTLSEELLSSSEQFDIVYETKGQKAAIEDLDLSGKKVAIYSLMEKAAQRAGKALEELYPGIKVVLNHDHTATTALVHLSQSADYFVFASRAAKHQAFYPVTKQRSDIIYPDGKGSMSIIRAFTEAVH